MDLLGEDLIKKKEASEAFQRWLWKEERNEKTDARVQRVSMPQGPGLAGATLDPLILA